MRTWNEPTNNRRDDWDDSTHTYRGYDNFDQLVEERPYTAEEIADSNEAANKAILTKQGIDALVSNLADIQRNDAALAVANPSNAQVIAQVKELSRQSTRQAKQINALIRLVLNQLDDTT